MARLASQMPAASNSTPAPATQRTWVRSATMPAGTPAAKYRNTVSEKVSATPARPAWNSSWNALKNEENEYVTPNRMHSIRWVAATTTQP